MRFVSLIPILVAASLPTFAAPLLPVLVDFDDIDVPVPDGYRGFA